MYNSEFVYVKLPELHGMKNIERANDTAAPFRSESTLHELFEETVERFPHRTAVSFEGESISYAQLNRRANRIAHFLRSQMKGQEQIVGIITERSFEMMAAIYGTLKSGGAYLPLSAFDPPARVSSLLQDAQPVAVLVQEKHYERYAPLYSQVYCIEDILAQDLPEENPPYISRATDLAYVIFTSGSTGLPKGVLIEHRAVVNRLNWMQQAYPISPSDVILQKTPYTFDVSVWEIFWWGLQGASVCLPAQNSEKNPLSIVQAIAENGVTVLHFVPSMFNMFLEGLKLVKDTSVLDGIKWIFTSGEALQTNHVKKFDETIGRNGLTKLINLYGPTEATVDVTHFNCSEPWANEIPIGKPIDNIQMHVIKSGVLQSVSDSGELCISGVGLARGYLNRPGLTADKFTYPFGPTKERVYRTGDMAFWNEDANICYLGRQDAQVKIRGIRIELGEIEAALSEYPAIRHCMVDIKKPSENVVLLNAFYVAEDDLPEKEMKAFLRERLPEYMIPNFIRRIKEIPLTAHGKLNKKAVEELTLK